MQGRQAFVGLIKRDLILAFRTPGQTLNPVAFYLMVASLFPMGISPQETLLSQLAGGVVWIGALLAVLLSLDSLFKGDQEDGSLDQLLLSPHPLPLLVLAKVTAHWLTTGVALILMAPLLGLMLHLPARAFPALIFSLLLGTPLMSLAGGIGAALTVRVHRGGVLLTLLSLPLYIPVLIFGTGAIQSAIAGMPYTGHLLWMAALLVFGLCLAPLAIAGALRVVVDG
ncbi:heme exporter protein CcmB [Endozoicomonas gorgoniicola]|uniref:Heme exporter protein B n=1 Tax=Endozoicomonas gorgoniicola TaxID=1234144 RepID=A0ABT3MVM0_9GAMM|nr:heme exporter protein CcmB [Endozoicomonas gorgoniicola]MCW7553432.1 heme exporter protein CcmB [Endozoicomonas gorgoniicola]